MTERIRNLGAFRWRFAQHDADPVGFAVPATFEQNGVVVSDPQSRCLARLLSWRDTPPGAPPSGDDLRSSVQVVDAAGRVSELLAWRAQSGGVDGDNLELQWSPRGDVLTVTWTGTPGERSTALIDATSGALVTHVPATLVGSASFSPDGSRLLVSEDEVAHIHDVDTGSTTPVPLIPGRQGAWQRRGTPRLLGFADDDHLLFVTQRGRTMTLTRGRLDGNDVRPLLHWTGGNDMYLTICRPTPDYWMF